MDKFYLSFEGGKEPGLLISGTKEGVARYAQQLHDGLNKIEGDGDPSDPISGIIPCKTSHADGSNLEWFAFRIVSEANLERLYSKYHQRSRIVRWLLPIGALFISLLAIKGLISLFP